MQTNPTIKNEISTKSKTQKMSNLNKKIKESLKNDNNHSKAKYEDYMNNQRKQQTSKRSKHKNQI